MSAGGRTGRWLRRALVVVAAAFGIYFLLNCFRIVNESRSDERHSADAIVVFGAAEYDGRPSPIYRARLDHAFQLYSEKLAPVVITTGGAGGDPKYTEGAVGRDYLNARGVHDRDLIAETQGENSAESADRIAVIMNKNRMRSCIAVSDPYHVFRIKRLLEAHGFVVYSSPRRLGVVPSDRVRFLNVLRESLSYSLWRLHVIRW